MSSHIDQAISGLKKAEEQYIKYGLTTIPEITSEFLNLCSTDTAEGLEEYRVLMKEYVEMDHDSKLFIRTLDQVKRLIGSSSLSTGDVRDKLEQLYETGKEQLLPLADNEDYESFERVVMSSGASASGTQEMEMEGEDLVVQEETNTLKCPYTGKQMVSPMKNTNCGHSYDREGITLYIKQRGKRAKCPFSGCVNQTYITQRCLVADKKLRKEIERRQRLKD